MKLINSNQTATRRGHEVSQTSRERPKSAPYLKLKKTRKRKPLFLQLETTKALKKLKIEKKKFEFFSDFFLKFPVSRIVPKNVKRGGALGFFEHPFYCKISKIDGRNNKRNFGKKSVSQCRKKEESLIVSKKVDPSDLEWLFISF